MDNRMIHEAQTREGIFLLIKDMADCISLVYGVLHRFFCLSYSSCSYSMGHLILDSRALALVAILFVVGYVVSTLYQWARLRHFKGPAFAGFSQLWLISTVGGGRTHLDLWEACKKYGKSCDVMYISVYLVSAKFMTFVAKILDLALVFFMSQLLLCLTSTSSSPNRVMSVL